MGMRKLAGVAFAAAAIGAIIATGALTAFDGGGGGSRESAASTATADKADTQSVSISTECQTASDIFESVRPSVVEITSVFTSSGPFGQQSEGTGTGTGVVIDKDGHILTNNHVVNDARTIEVHFSDGTTVPAEFVGADTANDLAVIKVDPSAHDLTVATLGDSDALRVGDAVLAIGNPFSLEGTLTQGIVSALDRTYSTGGSTRPIRGMIQTDAAVNPGNSGGPLINCHGEVIGINSLLENPTGENVNVGVAFAVAINTAKNSMNDMLAGDSVSHPWLGIAGVNVTAAIAEQADLGDVDSGVYLTLVSNGSPADDAGLQGAFSSQEEASNSTEVAPGGDVIIAVDGNDVTSIDQLAGYLDENKKPGDSVQLTVIRDGEQQTVEATLAEWPS